MIIGQYETVFKQYTFSQKCWVEPGGETELLPKNEGYSRMVSGFVSRSFGVGLLLSQDELDKVNERRMGSEWGHYVSKDSAMTVYATTKKKKLTDNLTLVRFFDVGVNLEGFWNYDQMALQVEDVYDVLSVKFPNYDFLFMLDQSSGHGKMREGSLNTNLMSMKFGGKQERMRDTTIKEIGPYQCLLKVGDSQSMCFKESDDGPFYLPVDERLKRKYDTLKGETKIVSKTKKELKDELKKKGYHVRGHCTKEKLEDLAKEYNVELTSEVELVEEGWVNRPKGLLQVLWERGWIDVTKLSEYTLKGKANQMDGDQNILPEYRRFVLRHLMSQCADFKEEKSAMEVLLEDLSKKSLNNQKVELLVSPKYHCELDGEGVEYD